MGDSWLGGLWDEISDYGNEFTWENLKGGAGILGSGLEELAFGTPKRGLDYLTSLAGQSLAGNDPFSAMKVEPGGRVSVPTIGEQATGEISQPFIKSLARNAIDLGANPGVGALAIPGAGTAMIPSMAKGFGESAGDLWSEVDRGEGFTPQLQEKLGGFIPTALLTGAMVKGAPASARELSPYIPEMDLGRGYTTRSPISLDPGGGGLDIPNYASAFGERERQNPLQTLAEHGSPTRSWFDRGESPKPSGEGAYGAGLYTSQVPGEAPGFARTRSSALLEHPDLFLERVRGEMVPLKGDPTVLKGDVSAEKPLFLEDSAPRDLRMQALIELQKARRSGLDPEYAEQLKNAILRPEATGHDLVDIGRELVTGNIPQEARATYTGDPYSEFIKSRDYDAWGVGKSGEPQRELVLTDPRRQFKVGETYDPREGSREVLADSSGEGIPPIERSREEIIAEENANEPPIRSWEDQLLRDTEAWKAKKLEEQGASPEEVDNFLRNASKEELVSVLGEFGGNKLARRRNEINKIEFQTGKSIYDQAKPVEPAQSLANPTLRVSEPPPTGPRPIELGQWLGETARDLGYTDLPGGNLTSRMVEKSKDETSRPTLSPNADALKTILKGGKINKFTPKTIVDAFEKAGVPVPEELQARIPDLLGELENAGWVNRKATGTYTFNQAPLRTSTPPSPMGKELDLAGQLQATSDLVSQGKSLADIEAIKRDILSKPVKAIRGEESIPLQTPVGAQEGSGMTPPVKPPKPPGKPPSTPPPSPPKRPEGYKEESKKSLLDDITDLPKTLKSAMDVSYPLRQGLFLLNRPEGIKAMGKGLKSVKESSHLATRAELESRPNKELYSKHGLNQIEYDPTTPTAESEFFPSALAEKISGVKQSQRVYNDQSNLMRADMFDSMVKKWSEKGMTPESHPKLYDGLSKYLNVLTGRDPLPKKLAQAGHLLNKAFWSPQFVKSRLQLLNPKFYWDLPKPVKAMALRDVGGTIGVISGLLTVTAMAAKSQGVNDISVQGDPRHTDFGKLRIGKQTYDLFSGLLPIIRAASRITTGTMKTRKGEYNLPGGPGLGRSESLKDAPFGRTSATELGGFVEGKTSPLYQIGKGILSGEGFAGEPYGGPQFLEDIVGPMGIMDVLEAGGFDPAEMKDIGPQFKSLDPLGMAKGLPSLAGVGVQTDFERKKKKESKKHNLSW